MGEIEGSITEVSAEEVAFELKDAKGYDSSRIWNGVAQAQHVVKDIEKLCVQRMLMFVLRFILLPEDCLGI